MVRLHKRSTSSSRGSSRAAKFSRNLPKVRDASLQRSEYSQFYGLRCELLVAVCELLIGGDPTLVLLLYELPNSILDLLTLGLE